MCRTKFNRIPKKKIHLSFRYDHSKLITKDVTRDNAFQFVLIRTYVIIKVAALIQLD